MRFIAVFLGLTSCWSPSPHFQCCGDDFTETVFPQPVYSGPLTATHIDIATDLLGQPGMPSPADASDVAIALIDHSASHAFWDRAREVSTTTQSIRQAARNAGASEAAVGAAYLRTTLRVTAVSPECRAGVWDLPLDYPGLRIAECRSKEGVAWDGETPAVIDNDCQVLVCGVDERLDPSRSTAAVVQGDWMAGLSPSRVIAVYALLTCVTDAPLPLCAHVKPAPAPPVGG
jgi:hypothetical protein